MVALRIAGVHYDPLYAHLYPGDGLEAVAVALCGRFGTGDHEVLCVHELFPIPYEECIRESGRLTWPTARFAPLLERADRQGLAVLKVHSHPGGFDRFSDVDDAADEDLFSSVFGWVDDGGAHASAILLPDGRLFGRAFWPSGESKPLERVLVAGHDVHVWDVDATDDVRPFAERHAQAFGAGTTAMLGRLSIAVVGCSGTGSPVVEQLARLGVGELVLVDPDRVEERNVNRIFGATIADAAAGLLKVDVLAREIEAIGLGTKVTPVASSLFDHRAIHKVASCDVVFGCMDSVDGRMLLNRLATYYLVPYIDVGVKLEADGLGGVDQVCGTVNYVQPGGSSLRTRGLFTTDDVQAAALKRTAPAEYARRREEKYIRGVAEDRPAVISVNTIFAGLAVTELLARLHPFRVDSNAEWSATRMSVSGGFLKGEPESSADEGLARRVGRGDTIPPLDYAALDAGAAR